MPSISSTFVSPLLTDVSVAYKNASYVADRLFPVVYVNKITGLYFVADKEAMRRPADARRAEYGRANRVVNTLAQASYTLEEKSLETPISDIVMANYDNPFDPKKSATLLVTEKLAMDKEKDLVTTITGAGAPGIDASNGWSTITTDIVGQIRTGRNSIQRNTGQKANVAVVSKTSLDSLMTNTAFIESVKFTTVVNEANLRTALAQWFDVETVIIGDSVENTAKEGQTDVMSYVWSDMVVLAYVPSSAALETPAAGYTLTLTDGRYVDEWYEQENKTTVIRANDFYDSKIVDANAMYVITNTTT